MKLTIKIENLQIPYIEELKDQEVAQICGGFSLDTEPVVISLADAVADADDDSQANALAVEAITPVSTIRATNKGLANSASRAFSNSALQAAASTDGRGQRKIKLAANV